MRIGRRIEALENLIQPPEWDSIETERRRAEFKTKLERAREEAEVDPARHSALEALEEQMRKRIRARSL